MWSSLLTIAKYRTVSINETGQVQAREVHVAGMGIPPKITTRRTTTTIPAITSGIKNRKTANAMTAIMANISRVSVEPSNASNSIVICGNVKKSKSIINVVEAH